MLATCYSIFWSWVLWLTKVDMSSIDRTRICSSSKQQIPKKVETYVLSLLLSSIVVLQWQRLIKCKVIFERNIVYSYLRPKKSFVCPMFDTVIIIVVLVIFCICIILMRITWSIADKFGENNLYVYENKSQLNLNVFV